MKNQMEINLAEFYLENGNHIRFYHKANVLDMIEEYEQAVKNNDFFFIGNWNDFIEELWYNGRILDTKNFSFPASKVDLHKFEG